LYTAVTELKFQGPLGTTRQFETVRMVAGFSLDESKDAAKGTK
jgi:hypothetical protein